MRFKNWTDRSKEFKNDTDIYDNNGALKHQFSTNVYVYRLGERLNIPGIIMLTVSKTDYTEVNGWLSIHIKPKKVTFISQGSETSEELADCSAETITTAILSYLDNFPSIKSEDVFEKAWNETEKDLKEAIDTLLNIWRDFDIDKAIAEIEQEIQNAKDQFSGIKRRIEDVQKEKSFEDAITKSGISFPIALEFEKMNYDCRCQHKIDDLAYDLEALQMIKEEMTK